MTAIQKSSVTASAPEPTQPTVNQPQAPRLSSFKSSKLFAGGLLLVAILIVAVGRILLGRTYFAPQSATPVFTVSSTLIPTQTLMVSPAPTAGWKTYTNIPFGYQLEYYSADWAIVQNYLYGFVQMPIEQVQFITFIRDKSEDVDYDSLSITPIEMSGSFDWETWVSRYRKWGLTNQKESIQVINNITMTVIEGEYWKTEKPFYSRVYLFKTPKASYAIEIQIKTPTGPTGENQPSEYNQILSTFKFID